MPVLSVGGVLISLSKPLSLYVYVYVAIGVRPTVTFPTVTFPSSAAGKAAVPWPVPNYIAWC